jgi:hypothetical protein
VDRIEYRDVAGFPGYRVGSDGSVWSRWARTGVCRNTRVYLSEHWHRLSPSIKGRYSVILRRNGESHSKRVYRLVLEAFSGPCPPGLEACHKDDDQTNNFLSNLYWGTHESNCADRSRNGKHKIGSRSPLAKHDEKTIARAKGLLASGYSVKAIVSVTGVSRGIVNHLKKGNGWAHVGPEWNDQDRDAASKVEFEGKSSNVWLEHDGLRMIVEDWAKRTGILSATIRTRFSRGWTVERALTEGVKSCRG